MVSTFMDVYSLLASKKITEKEAAAILGLTELQLKLRMAKWGHRLPLLLATLDKIKRDEVSRDEAAQVLEVSLRNVNALMVSWNVARPLKPYAVERTMPKIKWEIRKKFAIEYIAGSATIEEAAENAEVSTRQIRRWVSDLLDKHFGMVFRDLAEISDSKRRRLASDIEEAEGLEATKINLINEIRRGEKSLEEEAVDRVLARKARKKKRPTTHA